MGGAAMKKPVPAFALPLRVKRLARNTYAVVDANGKAVSQEYWTEMDADAALDRLMRAAKTLTRPCICCQKPFESEGAHNRMCDRCRLER